jgi:hypothetical protein
MADEDRLLQQIGALIKASEERLRAELASKDDLKNGLNTSEDRLKQAILDSQEDTITTLKEYIETAYNMHYKRIEKIEDALDLPHPDKN